MVGKITYYVLFIILVSTSVLGNVQKNEEDEHLKLSRPKRTIFGGHDWSMFQQSWRLPNFPILSNIFKDEDFSDNIKSRVVELEMGQRNIYDALSKLQYDMHRRLCELKELYNQRNTLTSTSSTTKDLGSVTVSTVDHKSSTITAAAINETAVEASGHQLATTVREEEKTEATSVANKIKEESVEKNVEVVTLSSIVSPPSEVSTTEFDDEEANNVWV